jgi:cob(I)alamin adenosyltransferase
MVYLSKIYTRSGDQGETMLGDGTRVSKDDPRVSAYGTVDELNAALGVVIALTGQSELSTNLRAVQNDLFDIGADLCVPPTQGEPEGKRLRVTSHQVERLEKEIDRLNEQLAPLTSFVLPGGSVTSAWCHFARTVCRRAERDVVALARTGEVNAQVIAYINRLSDYLFVAARVANDGGRTDELWTPGKSR